MKDVGAAEDVEDVEAPFHKLNVFREGLNFSFLSFFPVRMTTLMVLRCTYIVRST